MASLVARAGAAAASLSSGRARSLGSGRLLLAPALPGHGALVLAGRRVGAGHGGVLAEQFMAPALARDVKVACHPPGICPKSVINDDEDDGCPRIKASRSGSNIEGDVPLDEPQSAFVQRLQYLRRVYGPFVFKQIPEYLTNKQVESQKSLRGIGERSYRLVMDIGLRLQLEPDTPLFLRLLEIGYLFGGVADTDVLSGVASTLVRGLDDLRRVVSEVPKANLSSLEPEFNVDDSQTSGDNEMVELVMFFYARVCTDIKRMFSGE